MTASTLKEPKTKPAKRFRVKIGDSYAAFNFDLHEKGILVKCRDVFSAEVFRTNATAGNAIQRTYEFRTRIRDSMYADWPKFDCVKYKEAPQVEEFQVQVSLED